MITKDEIFINLDTPIKCHHKGQLEEFNELVISAPNTKVIRYHLEIKDAFLRAIDKVVSNSPQDTSANDNSSADMKPKQVGIFLSMQGEKMADLLDEFKKIILTKNMSYLYKDGQKENLTGIIYDSFKLDDIEVAFGEYISNFILPSMK